MAIVREEEWPPGADIATTGEKTSNRQLLSDNVRKDQEKVPAASRPSLQ